MSEIILGMVHELFHVQFVTVADLLRKIQWDKRGDLSFGGGVGSLQRRDHLLILLLDSIVLNLQVILQVNGRNHIRMW